MEKEAKNNQKDSCTECGELLELSNSGRYRGVRWVEMKCPECGEVQSDEPDWDNLKGGVDYY